MFGIGTTELILILVIVLILFGPRRLPELAKGLGRMIHELRRSAVGLRDEIERPATAAEEKSTHAATARKKAS